MVNKQIFEKYIQVFVEENHKVNLISKNDEPLLWEKHICDSLALSKVFNKYGTPEKLLDIGTGGGFPSVPISIIYPQIKITAIDSIGKKIKAIQNIKNNLDLKNLYPIWDRVENINTKFDIVTARAVASLDKICSFALPKTKKDGYFVAFKSKKAQEEINSAQINLKKHNAEIIDIIEYQLPIKEKMNRNLIIIKKL